MAATVGNFQFLQSFELFEILQNIVPTMVEDDPLFEFFPINAADVAKLIWNQRDNYRGLTAARDYDGPYGIVKRENINQFEVTPAGYGDQKMMDGSWLTNARGLNSVMGGIDLSEAQGEDVKHLLTRAFNRIRSMIWTLLTTGTYSTFDPQGNLVATDSYSFTPYTVVTTWSNLAASTPMVDLLSLTTRKYTQSAVFDSRARIYMHQQDANNLINSADTIKRVIAFSGSQVGTPTLATINNYLQMQGAGQIVIHDGFWEDDNKVDQPFIQPGHPVLIGKRINGEPVGEFFFTRNVDKMGAGGSGTGTGDSIASHLYVDFELEKNPTRGVTTLSFAGAPAVYYPTAIVPINT